MALNKNQKIVASVIAVLILLTIVLLIFTLPKLFSKNTSTINNTNSLTNSISIPALSLSKINIDIESCNILNQDLAKKYLNSEVENISNTKFTNISSCAYKNSQNHTIGINLSENKDVVDAELTFENIKKSNSKFEAINDLKDKALIDTNTFQLTFQKNKYTGSISIIKNDNNNVKDDLINLYKELNIN
jgi:hypothetical protein